MNRKESCARRKGGGEKKGDGMGWEVFNLLLNFIIKGTINSLSAIVHVSFQGRLLQLRLSYYLAFGVFRCISKSFFLSVFFHSIIPDIDFALHNVVLVSKF